MPTLVVSITLFVLALLIGIEVIGKVPATLHTPLMSGANSIHGIVIVGVVIVAAEANRPLAYVFIFLAAVLGTMNVVGGYVVTDRMLEMFKSSKNEKKGSRSNDLRNRWRHRHRRLVRLPVLCRPVCGRSAFHEFAEDRPQG